jgi:DNA-binding NtrC family response regulator
MHWREAQRNFKIVYWKKVLKETGSVSEASRKVGIHRTHLHKVLKDLGIETPLHRKPHRGNWGNLVNR